MDSPKEHAYRRRIEGAYRAAWWLKVLAWMSLVTGLVSLVATAVAFIFGAVGGNEALALVVGTAFGGILTGGTAYASATSLGISGARLEIAIEAFDSHGGKEPVDLSL
jgi:hypothetical protein